MSLTLQAAHAPTATFKRQLILLTDGQTSEPELTLKMARDHALACRLSVLGVGSTAARHFLRMLAKAGGGVAEFVPEKQNSVELGGVAPLPTRYFPLVNYHSLLDGGA